MIDCSVLLATRDRQRSLDRTLASLERQIAPGITWDVLVADNGSTDDTIASLARWSERLPLRWAVEPIPGKNRALNRVLGQTRGRLLLFTDDDVVLAPGWIAAHAAAAARWPDHDIFGGVIRPLFPVPHPSWVTQEPFRSILFAAYEHGTREQPTTHLPFGPNYAVRAPMLVSTGFDAAVGPNGAEYAMGGETELLRRLTQLGARTVYVPSAIVEHVVRPEQLTHTFVAARAGRFGRGLVRLGDVEWSPHRLFGAPDISSARRSRRGSRAGGPDSHAGPMSGWLASSPTAPCSGASPSAARPGGRFARRARLQPSRRFRS